MIGNFLKIVLRAFLNLIKLNYDEINGKLLNLRKYREKYLKIGRKNPVDSRKWRENILMGKYIAL